MIITVFVHVGRSSYTAVSVLKYCSAFDFIGEATDAPLPPLSHI